MTELDEHIRRLVDQSAAAVSATEVRTRVVGRVDGILPHRRRNRTRVLIAVGAAALIAIAAALALAIRDEPRNRIVSTSDPTTTIPMTSISTTSTTKAVVTNQRVAVISDQRLLEVTARSATMVAPLAGVRESADARGAPVRTTFGIVAAATDAQGSSTLQVYGDGGAPARVIATQVRGFVVSGDGLQVAYARAPFPPLQPGAPGAATTIAIADLATGAVRNQIAFRGFDLDGTASIIDARPVGWAENVVLLNTGDGASAMAAIWKPASGEIRPVPGYTSFLAVDVRLPRALLSAGDGGCAIAVAIHVDGGLGPTGTDPAATIGCGRGAFSPSGDVVATGRRTIEVVSLSTAERRAVTLPAGNDDLVTQISWLDGDTFAVVRGGQVLLCRQTTCTAVVDGLPVQPTMSLGPAVVETRPAS
jgi:hypothetical protein